MGGSRNSRGKENGMPERKSGKAEESEVQDLAAREGNAAKGSEEGKWRRPVASCRCTGKDSYATTRTRPGFAIYRAPERDSA